MYITHIHESFNGDAIFPKLNYKEWEVIKKEYSRKDDKNSLDFTIKTYRKKMIAFFSRIS